MVVAQLIFEMAANVGRLQSDMSKANQTVSSAMQGMRGAADMAKKALGAVGLALGVREFADMVKGSAEAMEKLLHLAEQTGLTVETLSGLKSVAKQSGTDLDAAAGGVNRLEKNMRAAVDGNKKMIAAFEGLGYTREQLQEGLQHMDTFLPDFAKRLMDSSEGGDLAAEAMAFMGRSGAQLLPFIKGLAEAGEIHARVTTAQAKESHAFLGKLRELEAQTATVQREFTLGMLPALNSIASAFIRTGNESDQARSAGEVFGTMIRWSAQILYGFWTTLNLTGKALGMVAAAMVALGTGHPIEALNIVKEGINDIKDTAAKAGEAIGKMGEAPPPPPSARRRATGIRPATNASAGDESGDYAGEFADGGTIPPGAWGVVGEAGPEIVSGGSSGVNVSPMRGGGANTLGAIAEQAKRLNKELRETKILGADAGDLLERAGIRGVKSLKDLDGVVRNLAVELLRLAANPLMKGASSAIGSIFSSGAASAASSAWGDFAGGFASGGRIPAGEWGVVGENGPEAVYGGASGASVVPGGGGGDTHTYYIDARGADNGAINRLATQLRSLNASVEFRAVDAVRKAFNARGYVTAMG